ncbi:MAG: PKD domain-containing protein [Chitinophagales bacterium]
MNRNLYSLFSGALLCLLISGTALAQTYTIGANNGANNSISYPTAFGDFYKTMRTQFLYRADELIAEGMSAGFITQLSWNVQALPAGTGVTEDYSLKIMNTAVSSLGLTTWEEGATLVWGPTDYTAVLGTNTFVFDTPFFWDGVSNILIEICGGDPAGEYTSNARVTWTGPLAYNASHTFRSDTQLNICDYTGVEYFDYTPGGMDYRPRPTFTVTPGMDCNLLPIIGDAVSTASSVCIGENFTVSVDAVAELGVTYQWSKSADGLSWTNIPGATGPSYTTTQTTQTFYRNTVTCIYSGDNTTSGPVFVDQNAVADCYCIPGYTYGTTEGDYISNVHLGTINNSTGALPFPYYNYYSALSTNVNAGSTYTITITCGSYATLNGVAAWIDYNQNGVFEASEKLGEVTGLPAFGTGSITFTVPLTAADGVTHLRTRDVWNTAGITACDTYGYGETEDYNVNISAGTAPTANFTYTGDPVVFFTDASTGSPTSWSWTFGDGGTSATENPLHIYAANGTYNVCLTATNALGSNTFCQNVVIDSYLAPEAFFMFAGDPTVTFVDMSTNTPTSWSWNFGDGGTSVLENPTHTYTTNGTYNACLTATNATGSDSYCASVVIDSYLAPAAAFSWTGDPTVTFTDLSLNTPTSWSWDFDDGGTSILENPTHTYAENGTYHVCLTATNATGSNTACNDILISSYLAPAAAFTWTGDPAVTFTDLSLNDPTSWSWDFDDGGTSVLENPAHTYADNGTYHVCLTATNATGSNTACNDVVISTYMYPPVVDFSWTGDPATAFTDLSTNDPYGWEWDFGDGGTSTLENPSHTYAADGSYNVCLSATNDIGTGSACHTVTIDGYPAMNAMFIYSGDPEVLFADLSTGSPDSWDWDFDDGATASIANPTHTFAANGTYHVCLAINGPGGTDTYCADIVIASYGIAPVADFTYSGSTLTMIFTDISANEPNDWYWEFGDGAISGLQNPVHTFPVADFYNVCLTASNDAGSDTHCISVPVGQVGIAGSAIPEITVYPNPAETFTTIQLQGISLNDLHVAVINTAGQEVTLPVMRTEITHGIITLQTADLPAGNYVVKISNAEGIYFTQLIKMK